jgi:hypothetical protein
MTLSTTLAAPRRPPSDAADLVDLAELLRLGWSPRRVRRLMRMSESTFYRRLRELRRLGDDPGRREAEGEPGGTRLV